MHKSETLHNLPCKKAAKAILRKPIDASQNVPAEAGEFTFQAVLTALWWPILDRQQIKASTRRGYECALKVHILPQLGAKQIREITPLHIENLLQKMYGGGASTKTVRNVVGILPGIFTIAVENDLIARTPVRKQHRPRLVKSEKPVWTPEQLTLIVESVPKAHRSLFQCAMLTGARLGELLGLQWKRIDFDAQTLEIRQALWNGCGGWI